MGKDLRFFHNLNYVYVLSIHAKVLHDGSDTFCQLIGIYSVYYYLYFEFKFNMIQCK